MWLKVSMLMRCDMDNQKAQVWYDQVLRDWVMGRAAEAQVEKARNALIKARKQIK